MMIMSVPWMNPLAFEGIGVPLNIIQDVKKVTTTNDPSRPRKPIPVGLQRYQEEQRQIKTGQRQVNTRSNPKKTTREEMMNGRQPFE